MASRRDYTPRSSPLASAADSKTRTGATPSRIVSGVPHRPRPLSASLPRSREFGPFPPPAAPRPKSASHFPPPQPALAHVHPTQPRSQWLTASPGPPPFSRTRAHGVVMPVHASHRRPRTAPAALFVTDSRRGRGEGRSGRGSSENAAPAPPKAGEFGELRPHHHHRRSKTEQPRSRGNGGSAAAVIPRHAKSSSCLRSVREEDPEECLEEPAAPADKAANEDDPHAATAVAFSLPPAYGGADSDDTSSAVFLDDLSPSLSVKSAATTTTATSTITATSAIWPVLPLNNNNSKETSNKNAKAWRCRWQRFLRFVHIRNTTKGLEQ